MNGPRTGYDWISQGLCRDFPEVDFFPSDGSSGHDALRICAVCPVREPCLEHALTQHEYGIWGGTSERARARIRRGARRRHAA